MPGLRPEDDAQPPYLYPDYVVTRLRAQKKPLLFLPRTLSDTTAPACRRGRPGALVHACVPQEPSGDRQKLGCP